MLHSKTLQTSRDDLEFPFQNGDNVFVQGSCPDRRRSVGVVGHRHNGARASGDGDLAARGVLQVQPRVDATK